MNEKDIEQILDLQEKECNPEIHNIKEMENEFSENTNEFQQNGEY